MTEFVVDASVAIMLLFPEPLSAQAIALFRDAQRLGRRIVAPHVLPFEATNAIRRQMRRERLSLDEALESLEDFLTLPINLVIDHDLHRSALRLTEAHSLGGHDAHYVALAQRLGCEFWTADERIRRAVAGQLDFVRFIGDYVSPDGDGAR